MDGDSGSTSPEHQAGPGSKIRDRQKRVSTLHRESSLTLELEKTRANSPPTKSDQREDSSTSGPKRYSKSPSQTNCVPETAAPMGCVSVKAWKVGSRVGEGGGGAGAGGGGGAAVAARVNGVASESEEKLPPAKGDDKLNEYERRILMAKSLRKAPRPNVKKIIWYHGGMTRHIAESLLLSRDIGDGTYLLRDSTTGDSLTLSARCKTSVKHYRILWDGKQFCFGLCTFQTVDELMEHFENQPIISGDSGMLLQLSEPYPRNVSEPAIYDDAAYHQEILNLDPTELDKVKEKLLTQDVPANSKDGPLSKLACLRKDQLKATGTEFINELSQRLSGQDLACNSKEGYLTKLGYHRKNWKRRWFVMFRDELKYFDSKEDTEPLRVINLKDASAVDVDHSAGKSHCFKLVTSYRTFFMFADNEIEKTAWVDMLQWKLSSGKMEM